MNLEPQIQAILDDMAAQPQPDAPPTIDEVRAVVDGMNEQMGPEPSEMASITDLEVQGPNGPIRCVVNTPRATDEPLPVFVYFHGGGCVLGTADGSNPTCTNIAAQADCIVVNVDYRLAPENPFPAPLDDAFAAYKWCVENAADIGADKSRIAVGGDSAGGYLAAAVCLEAKANGVQQPTYQLLIYPEVDMADRSESMVSIDAFINEEMLGGLHAAHVGDNVLDPRASPLRATDHSGLAAATVIAASHDPLVDQGRGYAAVLRRAGVPVEYRLYEGTIHAFFTWGGAVDIANTAVGDAARDLSSAFAAG